MGTSRVRAKLVDGLVVARRQVQRLDDVLALDPHTQG